MDMDNSVVTVRLQDPLDQNVGPLRRITGFIKMRGMIDLITKENLEANPRDSKRSNITKDILETLQTSPEMMPFYSKGLLIGAGEVIERERDRFQLEFADRQREGILDGGHNTLAIGIALLVEAGVDSKAVSKIKVWNDFKECWNENLNLVTKLKQQPADPTLDALIPVEILTPLTTGSVGDNVAVFNDLILSICANRNQNAQLAAEAVANQSGAFDYLKAALPEEISNEVAWRTNGAGRIDPRFLVSLAWVPLAEVPTLTDYDVLPLSGTSAYSSKAEALSRFTRLIEAEGATEKTRDGKSYVVIDSYVDSAFDMVPEVLKCYDIIYAGYKDAYNANNGSFGRIQAVRKVSKKTNYTVFSNVEVTHDVPPLGFMMPVIYSLQALIKADKNFGSLKWIVDPVEFYSDKENLKAIIGAVKPIIEMADWDPQRVGKGAASYNSAKERARNIVLETLIR